ncbi:PREDICTED: VQ motif-containing protein 10-like [Tarenaya hassleriana]|uniref:VQ motif-containing protein 10-like n=1 Tax=Tarenaya hassleriana TaxID=28532 RepID=UPI00053C787C|nr:PREDICTED: VQ motif-containing protein 10-like [Tarenaya hassleriana]
MSGRREVKSEPMKVVFINTQYVETDARSFKSVVQNLTGKDATVAGDPSDYSSGDARGGGGNNGLTHTKRSKGGGGGGGVTELDRFFRELPLIDELYKSWSDD